MGNDDLKIHNSIGGAVQEAVGQKQSKLEGGHIYKIINDDKTHQYVYGTKEQVNKLQKEQTVEKMSFAEIKKTWGG